MNVTAEEFVDIETFAIKISQQCCVSFASGLQEAIDEERAADKLLYEQIARGFTRCNLLAFGNVLDQQRSFVCVELFEVKHVEQFEVGLRIVCSLDDLAA